jgi:hypothetical protein
VPEIPAHFLERHPIGDEQGGRGMADPVTGELRAIGDLPTQAQSQGQLPRASSCVHDPRAIA